MTEIPHATLPGTVGEIMKSPLQGEPERPQILIEGVLETWCHSAGHGSKQSREQRGAE